MINLSKIIENIPINKVAIITPTREITYSDLLKLKKENEKNINAINGMNVSIRTNNRLDFVMLLILLDGSVKNMLIMPPELDIEVCKRYFQEANINCMAFLEFEKLEYRYINENTYDTKTDNDFNIKNNIYETSWIIPTSGTTNIPKLVSHTLMSLTRTTKIDIESGSKFRWGLLYDIYRFAGLQVFLQSIMSGGTLIIPDQNFYLKDTINFFIEKKCNALSATPSFWRKILMLPESDFLKLDIVTLGGEIADEFILQALVKKFPNAKITHIYASTEAGVGFSVKDGRAGFPLTFLTDGVNGIKLKISDKKTLMIKPEKRIQKYIGNYNLYENDGYIDTGDIVEIKDDRVYFLGRDSGSINVGGNKVHPEEVEQVLLSSNLIFAAYVYAKKNPILGNIVCADVVLKDKNADKEKVKLEILKFCRKKLENFKVPAILNFVEDLEITQSGKLRRN